MRPGRAALLATLIGAVLGAQEASPVRVGGDSVRVKFSDADLRSVLHSLAPYLRKPIVAGEVPAVRVTLDAPGPIPTSLIESLLRGLLDARGFDLVEDSSHFKVSVRATDQAAATQAAIVQPTVTLNVMPLKHARAAEVAATINALFGVTVDGATRRGLTSGTLADELRRLASTPPTTPPPVDGALRATLTGPITLVPDERTNMLLVRGGADDARIIREAVQQLDLRPLQVLLEVLIVEASRDRSLDLSAGGAVTRNRATDTLSASLAATNPGGLVLQVMRMSRTDLSLRLGAAAARGEASIISRPVIVVSNNAEARFLVGSQRPFIQVSRSLPTDTPTRDQVIQYRDVGTKIVVRPSINQDGYVSLLVQQEMSSATEETQFGAPVISTREASTEVLVRDGQTIVLGGLTDSVRSKAQSGIPGLSAIPILGGLFGQARRRTAASEFFLFLTPHVIREDADFDRLTLPRTPRGRSDR